MGFQSCIGVFSCYTAPHNVCSVLIITDTAWIRALRSMRRTRIYGPIHEIGLINLIYTRRNLRAKLVSLLGSHNRTFSALGKTQSRDLYPAFWDVLAYTLQISGAVETAFKEQASNRRILIKNEASNQLCTGNVTTRRSEGGARTGDCS